MADQGEPRELTDPAALKALAHPLRQRILRQLDREGPATSTTLAKALGENTGATSYHLRQLAEHGFVDEVPDRGRSRERWWQARREWGDALLFARGALPLTRDELMRFWADYMELFRRYAAATDPPTDGARRFLVRFVAFPDVDGDV
jgi:DNA-binding transcriptional ArsR family regulator